MSKKNFLKNTKVYKNLKKYLKTFIKTVSNKKFLFYFCRVFPAVLLIGLFICPLGMESLDLSDATSVSKLIFPYKLPFYYHFGTFFYFISYSTYLLPFTALFLLLSLFLKDNTHNLLFVLNLVTLTFYLFNAISSMILCANTSRWYGQLPWYVYIAVGFTIISHCALAVYGMFILRNENPEYAEYKRMEKDSRFKTKTSIKTKLTATIIGTITVILLIFMELILTSYNTMFTVAISDTGCSQAEQVANIYDSASGSYEKISSFFRQQKESNDYASSPFERIDIIIPKTMITNKSGLYLEQLDNLELPDFDTLAYTTAIGKVSSIPEDERFISSAEAMDYIRRVQNGSYRKAPVYNKKSATCKYIYPVSYTRKEGHLLQGFAVVTYRQEILMKSLFKTKVFVFTMVIIFIYLSALIAFLISDFIINPLLFLKANVKKTSDSLSQILQGNSKINAEQLVFTDSITTHDEIKNLSKEIKNMVSIIKGIIPYISFSTLQAADRDTPKKSSYRELCFLFTDIRGFTTLCEGRQPKEIVDILNHYLDIETEIILNNGGDIDKFVGDEMMAFFSGPKKEYNACKAAMEIRHAMREQQQKALTNGEDFISMGIGINTGKVVFGSVGSSSRKDFTSIGDTVNLAARLEGANKAYGSKAIITEAVYEKLKDTFICRELDFITVKGKSEPVRIYEILQSTAQASQKLYEIKDLFEKGLLNYRKQQWEKAEIFFRECTEKYNDMPSVIFLDRIEHFKVSPPPKKWDGVFNMKVK